MTGQGPLNALLPYSKDIKRQDILQQMWRDPAKAIEMNDVNPGQGL